MGTTMMATMRTAMRAMARRGSLQLFAVGIIVSDTFLGRTTDFIAVLVVQLRMCTIGAAVGTTMRTTVRAMTGRGSFQLIAIGVIVGYSFFRASSNFVSFFVIEFWMSVHYGSSSYLLLIRCFLVYAFLLSNEE